MKASEKFTWKSNSAKALCASTGYEDALAAVRYRSLRLIEQAKISGPPFSPFALGLHVGVNRVVFSPMGLDACLLPQPDGYEVRICSEHNKVRQNFSMAHEIGHVFFFEVTGKPQTAKREKTIGANEPDREEEFLCDYAASELTMPTSYFFRDVRYIGPSIGSVFELARRYQTSLRATTIKFAEMGLWNCAFVFWRPMVEGSKTHFGLEACTRFGRLPRLASKELSLPNEKHLESALRYGLTTRGRELVRFGELEQTCYIESVRIGSKSRPRILTMIFMDRDAEHLAYSSYQNLVPQVTQKRLFDEEE